MARVESHKFQVCFPRLTESMDKVKWRVFSALVESVSKCKKNA